MHWFKGRHSYVDRRVLGGFIKRFFVHPENRFLFGGKDLFLPYHFSGGMIQESYNGFILVMSDFYVCLAVMYQPVTFLFTCYNGIRYLLRVGPQISNWFPVYCLQVAFELVPGLSIGSIYALGSRVVSKSNNIYINW